MGHRVGCILMNENAPVAYLALAAYKPISRHIMFGYQDHHNQAILDYFNIQNYPSVLCFIRLEDDTIKGLVFEDGNLPDYQQLFTFINERVLSGIKTEMPARPVRPIDYDSMWLEQFDDKIFQRNCVRKQAECVLALFPGTPNSPQHKGFVKTLKDLSLELEISALPIKIGIQDGLCYPELLEYLGVEKSDLPTIVVYDGAKQRIASYSGKQDLDNLLGFIEDFDSNIIGKDVEDH